MTQPTRLADRIAAEIRAEMAWQKKTTVELASALGIGVRAAQRRLNGDIEFGLGELDLTSEWLGVSKEQLFTGRRDREVLAS